MREGGQGGSEWHLDLSKQRHGHCGSVSGQEGGWQVAAAEKEGFDLEHLPTTYTNKRAIMGAEWEEWEE